MNRIPTGVQAFGAVFAWAALTTACAENAAVGSGGATASTNSSTTSSSSMSTASSSSTGLPCGGCQAPTPFCDEDKMTCVACVLDSDCGSAMAAHCDGGTCSPCTASSECAHLTGTTACDAGSCVECMLGDESACTSTATCDLLAKTCTGKASQTVQNCEACTNDAQCAAGHRCIAMDFNGSPHGHYCLKEPMPTCSKPFSVFINKASISGAAPVNYCGMDETLTTCEAVLALVDGWVCSGTDGMCSPDGVAPEMAVPGALCRQVGSVSNQCTYACGGGIQCPGFVPANTCGGAPAPTWCGG